MLHILRAILGCGIAGLFGRGFGAGVRRVLLEVDNLAILGGEHRFDGRFSGEFFVDRFDVGLPPGHEDADFFEQRVLKAGVQRHEAGVFLEHHVIGVIGLLLGGLLIAGPDRHEGGDVIATGKNLHQIGQHRLDCISNVARYRLGAVGKRLHVRHAALVIVQSLFAFGLQILVAFEADRALHFLGDKLQ